MTDMLLFVHEIKQNEPSKSLTRQVEGPINWNLLSPYKEESIMKSQKNATSELIKAASINRITDKATGKVLGYLVKSNSSDDYYQVTGKKVNGVCSYACTCKAGQNNFAKCQDGKCCHVKAVIEVVEARKQVATPAYDVVGAALTVVNRAMAEASIGPAYDDMAAEKTASIQAVRAYEEHLDQDRAYRMAQIEQAMAERKVDGLGDPSEGCPKTSS